MKERPIGYYVTMDGWAGIVHVPVEVVKETPKRIRIRFLADAYSKRTGQETLIPKDLLNHFDGETVKGWGE